MVEIATLLELVDSDRRAAEEHAIDGGFVEECLFGSVDDLLEELVFLAVPLTFETLCALTARSGLAHYLALERPDGTSAFPDEAAKSGTAPLEDDQTVHL